jgi:hypothetical protein
LVVTVSNAWPKVVQGAANTINGIWQTIRTEAGKIFNSIGPLITTVSGTWSKIVQGAANAINGIWDTIKSAAKTAFDAIKGFIDPIKSSIQFLIDHMPKIPGLGGGGAPAPPPIDLGAVQKQLQDVNAQLAALPAIFGTIGTIAQTTFANMTAQVTLFSTALTTGVGNAATVASGTFANLNNFANVAFTNMTGFVTKFATALISGIGNAASTASGTLANLNNFTNGVFTNMSKFPVVFAKALTTQFTTSTNAASNLLKALNNNSNGVFNNMAKQPLIFANALIKDVNDSTAKAKTAINSLQTTSATAFSAMVSKAGTVASAILKIGSAADTAKGKVDALKNAVNSLPNISRTITYTIRVVGSVPAGGSLNSFTGSVPANANNLTTPAPATQEQFVNVDRVARVSEVTGGARRLLLELLEPTVVKLNEREIVKQVNRRILEVDLGAM